MNGEVIKVQGTTVNPAKDKVEVSGKKVALSVQPALYYFAVNKPKVGALQRCCMCATS